MSEMVPMHGFGGGGGTGATLTVTAPAGVTVTVSKDGKTKTKVSDSSGVAVFKGLETGEWTVVISDGSHTSAQKTVTITADYSTAMSFFAATINITYPAGSVCTATDGITTLNAPDTSGTWACVVPNAGDWTVTVVDKGWNDAVTITQDGQNASVYLDKYYLYIEGNEYTSRTGGLEFSAGRIASYNKGVGTKGEDSIMLQCSVRSTAIEAVTANKIDLTNYSTLKCNVKSFTSWGRLIISSTKEHDGDGVSYNDLTGVGVNSLDISGINGSYYVCVYTHHSYDGSPNYVEFDKLWLE